jgi:hypothetical protein
MTECQRLFLVQARTDFAVFQLLVKESALPCCHALHYLQMATEKLGKAHAWKDGLPHNTHRAFVGFLRSLSANRQAQKLLGFEGQNANWIHTIRKSTSLAQQIEDLAPSLAQDGPNPEYPWPPNAPTVTPAEHTFPVWTEIRETPAGRRFVGHLLPRLIEQAHVFL